MTTRRSATQPLPRSLDPLHDESLVGYVLRLAYRTGSTPAEITVRTGLRRTELSGLSLRPLHDLDPGQLHTFCTATSLTPTEARSLLLSDVASRYGPLDPSLAKGRTAQALIAGNAWASFRNTRYCPECLSGSGTEIEQLLGGAWRKLWRIPAVFSCRLHQRLLSTRCSGCGQPAQVSKPGHAILHLTVEGLHPLQCRNNIAPKGTRTSTPCGARYDLPDLPSGHPPDAQTLDAVLRLQDRIETLLTTAPGDAAATFGWRTPIGIYFFDLWALSSLIFLTWPECRPLTATPTLAEITDEEVDQRRQNPPPHRGHGQRSRTRVYTIPPESSLASAAVLGIAERLLGAPDEETAYEALKGVIERSNRAGSRLGYRFRNTRQASVPFRATLRHDQRPWAAHQLPSRADLILKHPGMTRVTPPTADGSTTRQLA
ncbi:TniQ family protein [Streptomyces mirabilis]|uniref:TniQ family protein n=1 Tax=Streptomyces mirabilis TaxID=68239 RepID=UPI0033A0C5F2